MLGWCASRAIGYINEWWVGAELICGDAVLHFVSCDWETRLLAFYIFAQEICKREKKGRLSRADYPRICML